MTKFVAPISEAQSGLWYAQAVDPSNPTFNACHYIEIKGNLNVPIFFMAAEQVICQAEVLAIRFKLVDGQPHQYYNQPPQQQFVDLRHQVDARQQIMKIIEQDLAIPVNPCQDELVKIVLFAITEQHHIWYQRVHHLLTDGYAMLLLESQIANHYNQLMAIEAGQSAADVTAFADYKQILQANDVYLTSVKRQTDQEFWLQKFQHAEPLIPLKEGTALAAHSFLRYESMLDNELFKQLQQYAQEIQLTWPDVVTALTAVFLCRHTNTKHNIFGIPHMARLGQAAANIPAMVMNVLPLLVNYEESDDIEQFCIAVSKSIRQARRHGLYRSEQLRRDLGLLGGQKRLYGALINVLPFDTPMQLIQLNTERQVLSSGPVEDITINFRAYGKDKLILTIDANPKMYQQAQITELQQRLQHFITACLSATSFAEVPTVTASEWIHWIYEVNQTKQLLPNTSLAELIAKRVQQKPHDIALVYSNEQLSYEQFDQRCNILCQYLAQQGVQAKDCVALLMERSVDLVIAIHAVVKMGACYLPLDPNHPNQRLEKILAQANAKLLIGQTGSLANRTSLLKYAKQLDVSLLDLTTPVSNPVPITAPQTTDVAYIIFTSGSTGDPKGVVIEHQAVVNRLLWMQQHYRIETGERILQKTPATFDVSVWEFFLPFVCGATLVVAPPQAHKDPAALVNLVQRHKISIIHFVPSMLTVFLAEPNLSKQSSLKKVFCSGEALPANVRDRFHQQIDAELHNLYGPTEAAIDVSYWNASASDHSQPVPIGFPVWNTQLYILDQLLRPVPDGVVGNLYIAGRQLARGYLWRDDLTAQRFISNPFSSQSDAKMYDTGDLARWRSDGAIEFLGRSDFQVKMRGLRIELDEIQVVLSKYEAIANVAVIAREELQGQSYIAAYVVAKNGQALDFEQIKHYAAQQLPEYMLPTAWTQLTELPVTNNGKLNRAALPVPEIAKAAGRDPSSEVEIKLAELFTQVLQLKHLVSVEDDFFLLGGHSLLAAQLISRIRQYWMLDLGLGIIFERPTLLRLSQYIEQLLQGQLATDDLQQHGMAQIITLQPALNSKLPAIFCLHPAGGISWCYSTLARELQQQPMAVYGLQAPTLDSKQATPASMQALAIYYVEQIIKLQPQGPYHLVGWSIGGIIAQAMAVELQQRQLSVGMLALLDAYPSDVWRSKPEPQSTAAVKAIMLIAGYDPHDLGEQPLNQTNVINFLRQRQHPLGQLSDHLLAGIIRVVGDNNSLVRQHWHQRYQGNAIYFHAALDHKGEDLQPEQWLPYINSLSVEPIPSLHGHMLNAENSKIIASKMLGYLG